MLGKNGKSSGSFLNNIVRRWTCNDRRYLIKRTGSTSDSPARYKYGKCQWDATYSSTPADYECILTYCDNATETVNTDPATPNYNFTEPRTLVRIGENAAYTCRDNYRVEADLDWKSQADPGAYVPCVANSDYTDSFYEYPTVWPICLTDSMIDCSPDPGNSINVTRTHTTSVQDLTYGTVFQYKCTDPREWIKHNGEDNSQLEDVKLNPCHWRGTFPLDGTTFACVIHHCSHPHDDPGHHPPPPPQYNISLVHRSLFEVAFNDYVTYRCDANTFIENDKIDHGDTDLEVQCIDIIGEYNTPIKQGDLWPNCTETVICGQPPEPPINGTITWLDTAVEFQETYDTFVMYHCQNGSQFDTNNDGKGDSVNITIRCQWNKAWAPYPTLPPCLITHCVEPFRIPDETNLEEVTSEWTEIDTFKEYQCKGKFGDTPTMFWESDRTRSTFELFCKDDGYFTWEEWPICLEGMFLMPPF